MSSIAVVNVHPWAKQWSPLPAVPVPSSRSTPTERDPAKPHRQLAAIQPGLAAQADSTLQPLSCRSPFIRDPAVELPKDITRLLDQARAGEREAWASLLRTIYGDVKRLARRQLAQGETMPTLNTTGLVNEWYLRVADAGDAVPESRHHFFALTAKIMRQVICSYARERATAKRGGGQRRIEIDDAGDELGEEANRFVALDQALARLAEEDEDMVRVVECRFFAGMTEPETAEAVGIPLRTVQWLWSRARDRLAHILESP